MSPLLLALMLVASPNSTIHARTARSTGDSPFVDDAGLLGRFEENPARAEGMLGHGFMVVGRIRAIERPRSGAGYLITIAPRGRIGLHQLTCRVGSRPAVAALSRGQLVIVQGTLRQDQGRDLNLERCKIEYDFAPAPEVVARSAEACRFAEIDRYKTPTNLTDRQKAFLEQMPKARAKSIKLAVGMKLLPCSHPVLRFRLVCESLWMEPESWRTVGSLFSVTCKERHEMLDIWNAQLMTENETRSEAGEAFTRPEHEGGSRLFNGMVGAVEP